MNVPKHVWFLFFIVFTGSRSLPATDHMYVSFHGYNELRLENISQLALREIRDIILPRWEDGIESDIVKDSVCIVKFREAPWDMGGLKFLQYVVRFTSLLQSDHISYGEPCGSLSIYLAFARRGLVAIVHFLWGFKLIVVVLCRGSLFKHPSTREL